MSDIVERLEKDLREVRAWAKQDISRLTAEIERLRAENEDLRERAQVMSEDAHKFYVKWTKAQAALEKKT